MVRSPILVPGGHGRAFAVGEDVLFTLIDVEGQQTADFIAFSAAGLGETLSSAETRLALRSLYIKVGDVLMSSRGRPMLELVSDTIGVHDFSVPACDPTRFAVDFGCPGHRNCLENMYEPLRAYGVTSPLALPEPFNFFQSSPVLEGGRTGVVNPTSRAKDCITLRALMDLVCAVSSCPQDIIPGNGLVPTPIEIRFDAEAA
jgi:uncharacterized protein YcgI (DUF1989 family)